MNVNKFDVVIITTMTLSIVLMSLMFPALGLTDTADKGNESEIPEYNTTASGFDIVGEFPQSPGTPTNFELNYDDDELNNGDNTLFVEGDTSDGLEVVLTADTTDGEVTFNNWTSGSVTGKDSFTVTAEGDTFVYQNSSYTIEGEVTNYSDDANDDDFTADFEITQQPSDTSWVDRIPVVGGLFSAGEQLASIVGWIGAIVYWLFGALVETSIAVVSQLLSVVVYFVDMLVWLSSTYSAIVSAAGSWASFVLVVPAVLLFVEFAKLIAVGISLLPTT